MLVKCQCHCANKAKYMMCSSSNVLNLYQMKMKPFISCYSLIGTDTMDTFENNICDFLFAFFYTNPFPKRACLKRQQFASLTGGSKFFHLKVNPNGWREAKTFWKAASQSGILILCSYQ